MHIDHLPIPSAPAHNRRDNDESVFRDEIPYTSIVLCAVARLCEEFEFQRVGEGQEEEDGQVEEGLHFVCEVFKLAIHLQEHEEEPRQL